MLAPDERSQGTFKSTNIVARQLQRSFLFLAMIEQQSTPEESPEVFAPAHLVKEMPYPHGGNVRRCGPSIVDNASHSKDPISITAHLLQGGSIRSRSQRLRFFYKQETPPELVCVEYINLKRNVRVKLRKGVCVPHKPLVWQRG